MDRPQNMVVNIAFYENDFFILSLNCTGGFTSASCKSYLTPRNQRPAPRKQCSANRILEKLVKRTSVCVKSNCYLRLEDDVAMILGFEPGTTIRNSLVTSPYFSLSTGNVSSLYVYINIIHSQYVGDVKVPLLRIFGVDGQHGKSVTTTFDRPQYLPVCRQTLDTIEIDIKDDAGDSISFQHGNLKTNWQQNFISGYSDSLLLLIKIKSDNPYDDTLSIKPKVRAIISLGPGSLPGFQGARMQRGLGLGSLFRVFCRTALPLLQKLRQNC